MATKVSAERSAPQTVRDSCEEYRCEEYPCTDGDRICESQYQYFAIFDTIAALKTMFVDRPDVVVAGNLFVYYREGDPGSRVAPDIMVVFGASGKHYRHSWQVWREGGVVPSFVLEVASESTWRTDAGPKRDIYAAMGVTEYWRHDPEPLRNFLPSALIGERLEGGEYRPMSVYTDGAGTLRGHSPRYWAWTSASATAQTCACMTPSPSSGSSALTRRRPRFGNNPLSCARRPPNCVRRRPRSTGSARSSKSMSKKRRASILDLPTSLPVLLPVYDLIQGLAALPALAALALDKPVAERQHRHQVEASPVSPEAP